MNKILNSFGAKDLCPGFVLLCCVVLSFLHYVMLGYVMMSCVGGGPAMSRVPV